MFTKRGDKFQKISAKGDGLHPFRKHAKGDNGGDEVKKGSVEIAFDTTEQTGTEYGKVVGKDIKSEVGFVT